MTRALSSKTQTRSTSLATESWLFDEPDLDDEGLALLVAYRDAIESTRQVQKSGPACDPGVADAASPQAVAGVEGTPAPRQTGVLRLRHVDGVSEERFAGLHGQLLAAGYLSAEIVGRSDGLTYRITREGLQRLSSTPHMEAA